MADENSGPEESIEAQCDVVIAARERLKSNPELCKVSHRDSPSKTGEQHQHGSERCICAYLGEENWGKSKVAHREPASKTGVQRPSLKRIGEPLAVRETKDLFTAERRPTETNL
jgi:hypothetical protein